MLSMIHYVVYWYTVKRERDARQTVCVCVYDALVSTTECATHVTEVGCEGEDFSPFPFQPTYLLRSWYTHVLRKRDRGQGLGVEVHCVHTYICVRVCMGECVT